MVEWRFHVHDDDEYVSIGQEHKNDTLLKMPDGWRDREVVRGFADAFLAYKAEADRLREALEKISEWDETVASTYWRDIAREALAPKEGE